MSIAIEWIALRQIKRDGFHIDLETVLEWCGYINDMMADKSRIANVKKIAIKHLIGSDNNLQSDVDYRIIEKKGEYAVLLTDACFQKLIFTMNITKPYHMADIMSEMSNITSRVLSDTKKYDAYKRRVDEAAYDIDSDRTSIYWSADTRHDKCKPKNRQNISNTSFFMVNPLELGLGIVNCNDQRESISSELHLMKKIFMKALYIFILDPDRVNSTICEKNDYDCADGIEYDRELYKRPDINDKDSVYLRITKTQPADMAYHTKIYYKNEDHLNAIKKAAGEYKVNNNTYLTSLHILFNIISQTFIDMHIDN